MTHTLTHYRNKTTLNFYEDVPPHCRINAHLDALAAFGMARHYWRQLNREQRNQILSVTVRTEAHHQNMLILEMRAQDDRGPPTTMPAAEWLLDQTVGAFRQLMGYPMSSIWIRELPPSTNFRFYGGLPTIINYDLSPIRLVVSHSSFLAVNPAVVRPTCEWLAKNLDTSLPTLVVGRDIMRFCYYLTNDLYASDYLSVVGVFESKSNYHDAVSSSSLNDQLRKPQLTYISEFSHFNQQFERFNLIYYGRNYQRYLERLVELERLASFQIVVCKPKLKPDPFPGWTLTSQISLDQQPNTELVQLMEYWTPESAAGKVT